MNKKPILVGVLALAIVVLLIIIISQVKTLKINNVSSIPEHNEVVNQDTGTTYLYYQIHSRNKNLASASRVSVDGSVKEDTGLLMNGVYSRFNDENLLYSTFKDETDRSSFYQIDSIFLKEGDKTHEVANNISNDFITSPFQSLYGDLIAYTVRYTGRNVGSNQDIIIYSPKLGTSRKLEEINKGVQYTFYDNGYYELLGWSANNIELYAVTADYVQGGWQGEGVFAINSVTGAVRDIDSSNEIFVHAKLSPESKEIAYVPYKSTSATLGWIPFLPYTIKVFNIETGTKENLITSQDEIFGLSWSPDGNRILYSTEKESFIVDRTTRETIKAPTTSSEVFWVTTNHVVGVVDGGTLKVIDIITGKETILESVTEGFIEFLGVLH